MIYLRWQEFARRQSQPDRICTIEAVALFLRECGEGGEAVDGLLSYLRLNNAALRPAAASKRPKQAEGERQTGRECPQT
jgi:hypothetical protein